MAFRLGMRIAITCPPYLGNRAPALCPALFACKQNVIIVIFALFGDHAKEELIMKPTGWKVIFYPSWEGGSVGYAIEQPSFDGHRLRYVIGRRHTFDFTEVILSLIQNGAAVEHKERAPSVTLFRTTIRTAYQETTHMRTTRPRKLPDGGTTFLTNGGRRITVYGSSQIEYERRSSG